MTDAVGGAEKSAVPRWARLAAVAHQQAELFAPATVGTVCGVCGMNPVSSVVELQWFTRRTRFHVSGLSLLEAAVGHLPLPFKSEALVYSSFHGECRSCRRRHQLRNLVGSLGEGIGFILILAAIVGIFTGATIPLFFKLSEPQLWLSIGAAVGSALLFLAAAMVQVGSKIAAVPPALRAARAPGFRCDRTKRAGILSVEVEGVPRQVVLPKYRSQVPASISASTAVGVVAGIIAGILVFAGWIAAGVSPGSTRDNIRTAAIILGTVTAACASVSIRQARRVRRRWREQFISAAETSPVVSSVPDGGFG